MRLAEEKAAQAQSIEMETDEVARSRDGQAKKKARAEERRREQVAPGLLKALPEALKNLKTMFTTEFGTDPISVGSNDAWVDNGPRGGGTFIPPVPQPAAVRDG